MNTTETIIDEAANVEKPTFTPAATGEATYCPEDNKLRLYVGRVPRPEYDYLRAQGWTATPKQNCQFAATWTPARRDTALAYGAGIIGDEDQSPADRAADRAERFGGYRDKRTAEAVGHADRYDAGPQAHGYQSQARAERAAERHDKIADRATDSWSKAEYWTNRTAGVISNALYKSRPDVRMGRIKVLEAELRRLNPGGQWHTHTALRLAYENQMLEAQGGRAAHVEMVPGGLLGGKLIVKVCKSNVTGRVVSVFVKGPKVTGWRYMTRNVTGADYSLHQFETERMSADAYTAPTPESLAELAALIAEKKANTPKKAPCPLINPTDADAERLQALWNAEALEEFRARIFRNYGNSKTWLDHIEKNFKPSTVCRITQAVYSANSKGTHARAEARDLAAGGELQKSYYSAPKLKALCKIRSTGGDGEAGGYAARRVIVLTDKPQKPLPAAVWEAKPAEASAAAPVKSYAGKSGGLSYAVNA